MAPTPGSNNGQHQRTVSSVESGGGESGTAKSRFNWKAPAIVLGKVEFDPQDSCLILIGGQRQRIRFDFGGMLGFACVQSSNCWRASPSPAWR
jgi:hypothetical protein